MRLIAIDPGYTESAFCIFHDGEPRVWQKVANSDVLSIVRKNLSPRDLGDMLALEMVAHYGMPVGAEVFMTCLWVGRFVEAWERRGGRHLLVYRRDVKLHLCQDSRAKDSNIRAALLDRFGPGRELAVGTKRRPGPLYGMTGDCWSALAVGLTALHQLREAT